MKVNFFADYFTYVTNHVGLMDEFELENLLSLVEKVMFQNDTNFDKAPKYLDSYFAHPLLQKNNKYFKEFSGYKNLYPLFASYKTSGNYTDKKNWINDNPAFIKSLRAFRQELKRKMFKNAVRVPLEFLDFFLLAYAFCSCFTNASNSDGNAGFST